MRSSYNNVVVSQKIALEFTENLHKIRTKFPENSRAIFFLRNDFIIVRLSHLRNPAKKFRIAELRLMRNQPQLVLPLVVCESVIPCEIFEFCSHRARLCSGYYRCEQSIEKAIISTKERHHRFCSAR